MATVGFAIAAPTLRVSHGGERFATRGDRCELKPLAVVRLDSEVREGGSDLVEGGG